MVNKLALNTHFQRTISINDEKTTMGKKIKISLPIVTCDNKFLCFIICVFQSNQYFALSLRPHIC